MIYPAMRRCLKCFTFPTLSAGEQAVGYYVNDPTSFADLLFSSTSAVYVYRKCHWNKLLFRDIKKPVGPDTKQDVSGFNLLLCDGEQVWLPVTGSKDGRVFDAFSVLHFLMRVIGDFRTTV